MIPKRVEGRDMVRREGSHDYDREGKLDDG